MEKPSTETYASQGHTISRRSFLKLAGKAAMGTGGALLLSQADLQKVFAQGPEGTPQPTPGAPWEKAGVSKDIYLSYYNYAHQQLPPALAERAEPNADNPITFDFQKDGFVDARGRIYRPNLTEDPQDVEAGWVVEFDTYYSQKNNTTIVMEGNPDRLGKRKVGTKFTDIDFSDEFKSRIDDWIDRYGKNLKGQMVHLTFVEKASTKHSDVVAPIGGFKDPTTIDIALRASHFGYHRFIHVYASGEYNDTHFGFGRIDKETMFSMATTDALILTNSGYEGDNPATEISLSLHPNLAESANFLLPGYRAPLPHPLRFKYSLVTFPKP